MYDRRSGQKPYLKDVSSLSSASPSSDPALLTARFLLGARDVAGDCVLEVAGDDSLERALRETVLLLSRACLRKSCILTKARLSSFFFHGLSFLSSRQQSRSGELFEVK